MSTTPQQPTSDSSDTLIDEVRRIRQDICNQFGNDVDRLFDHLLEVQRDYAARRGMFADVTQEAAARVVESWGEQTARTDDAIVDELRAVRKGLARKDT
jgi:hypothetical protein